MESCVLNLIYTRTTNQIKDYIPTDCSVVVVIDAAIQNRYGNLFPYPQIAIEASEEKKNFKTIEEITIKLLDMGADRSVFILAVGGGILSDLTGFLASIYMRGVKFGYVPTTLLSQVDAAIGGKTAVNVMGYKNILGVINQPEFTIFCPEFLKSLPEKEIKAGVSEMLKAFILADRESYFEAVKTIAEKGLSIDAIWPYVKKATQIKAAIVERDPNEKGERKVLNLGHTFAHGLEKLCKISHGEAVSIGIVLAAKLSVNLGYLQIDEQVQIVSDFKRIGLATVSPVSVMSLFEAIVRDKKRSGNFVSFILIENIGKASAYPLEIKKLEEYLNDLS